MHISHSFLKTILSAGFLLASCFADAAVYHVNGAATGANTGVSWNDAFTDLQSALAVAQASDEIWVAQGVYSPPVTASATSESFVVPSGVSLHGGFAGNETTLELRNPALNTTTLSGLNGSIHAYHVVTIVNATDVRLDGFTIRDGLTVGLGETRHGAGIFIKNATGKNLIVNCWIIENRTTNGDQYLVWDPPGDSNAGVGAGIYLEASQLEIRDSTVSNNRTGNGAYDTRYGPQPGVGGDGAGLYCNNSTLAIQSSWISQNVAGNGNSGYWRDASRGGRGAGIFANASSVDIQSTFIEDNQAGHGGYGGAYFGDTHHGGAGADGGGLFAFNSSVVIQSSWIQNNSAGQGGNASTGGWYGNYQNAGPGGSGGGVFASGSTVLTLNDIVFAGNRAGDGGINLHSSYDYAPGQAGGGGSGGGLFASDSAGLMEINNCRFEFNHAGHGGDNERYPNDFNPTAGSGGQGGGINLTGITSALKITNCQFTHNSAGDGGDNIGESGAGGSGGGLYHTAGAELFVLNCEFSNNRAGAGGVALNISGPYGDNWGVGGVGGSGGGLYANFSGTVKIINSFFDSNLAGTGGANQIAGYYESYNHGGDGGHGGAVSIPVAASGSTIVNSLFMLNSAGNGGDSFGPPGSGGSGGAIYIHSEFSMINLTVASNAAGLPGTGGEAYDPTVGGSGGGIYSAESVLIANSILWGNAVAEDSSSETVQVQAPTLVIHHSCVEGWTGSLGGVGNIGLDPQFYDPTNHIYRLTLASPCIESGSSGLLPADEFDLDEDGDTTEPIPIDLDGAPRIHDTPEVAGFDVDMGAYEYPFDCNRNSIYDLFDIQRGISMDCNQNDIPDECDIASGFSTDCNRNGIPDECEFLVHERLYVDIHATGNNTGETWVDAFTDLQVALCVARLRPEVVKEIWVARGLYLPDEGTPDPAVAFELMEGISVYGGFAPGAASLDERDFIGNETILSGDLELDDVQGISGTNSLQVVRASGIVQKTLLDGFTITGATQGGVLLEDSHLDIRNCLVVDNVSSGDGGGIRATGLSTLELTDVVLRENTSEQDGGALALEGQLSALRVSFLNNAGRNGGAVYLAQAEAAFTQCRFEGNRNGGIGGGIRSTQSILEVEQCVFLKNQSVFSGGAIFAADTSLDVHSTLFAGNTAQAFGGALDLTGGSLQLFNSVISGNKVHESLVPLQVAAGAIRASGMSVLIGNCTFSGNQAPVHTGGILLDNATTTIANSIFWDNTTEDVFDYNPQLSFDTVTTLVVSYSCIQDEEPGDGNVFPGEGNIDQDPDFMNPLGLDGIAGTEDDDLLPFVTSPVIDAGNNTLVPGHVVKDIRGLDRFFDNEYSPNVGVGPVPIVDMGAYEFQGTVTLVAEEILPPEAIRSQVRYDFKPVISNPQLAFAHPSRHAAYRNRVYATHVGLVDIGWTVHGEIIPVTETYFIAPKPPTVLTYRTDMNNSPQVDLSPAIMGVPPVQVVFHSNPVIRGGIISPTDENPPDVGFMKLSPQSALIPHLIATRPGRIVIEYREAEEPGRPLAFEYLEIRNPNPELHWVSVSDQLLPSSPGLTDATCQPNVTRGLGDFIYQQGDAGPTKWRCYALRPTLTRSDMEIYWFREGTLGVKWHGEVRRYAAGWHPEPQYNVRSRDGAFPTVKMTAYQDVVIEYTDPPGHLYFLKPMEISSTGEGWATLRYMDDVVGGKLVRFEVVHTVDRTHPMFEQGGQSPGVTNWFIGDRIVDASHDISFYPTGFIYSGTGYDPLLYDPKVFEEPSKYDGSDKAIFAVNLCRLEVWFYEESQSISWPVKPIIFDCHWSPVPDGCIVISNEKGIGPFNPTVYKNPTIYVQEDPQQIGFNPNEEHARWILRPGEMLFAARDDLNAASGASEPYVLLRYQNGLNRNRWEYDIIGVVRSGDQMTIPGCPCTEEPCDFQYTVLAGSTLRPPVPLIFDQILCSGNTFMYPATGEVLEVTGSLDSANPSGIHSITLASGDLLTGELFPIGDTPFFEKPTLTLNLWNAGQTQELNFTELEPSVGQGWRFKKVAHVTGVHQLQVGLASSGAASGKYLLRARVGSRESDLFWYDDKGNQWFRQGDLSLTAIYEELWAGQCTPWLDGGMGGSAAQQIEWTVRWPQIASSDLNPPGSSKNVYTTLSFGQTRDRSGGIRRAEILYNSCGAMLIMPWKETWVDYENLSLFPPDYLTRYNQLPAHIRERLAYDTVNNILIFRGRQDLSLLGIMSPQERDLIQSVFSRNTPEHHHFNAKINLLYAATQQDAADAKRVGYTLSLSDPDAPRPGEPGYEAPSDEWNRLNPEWSPLWGIAVSSGSATATGWLVVGYNGRRDILEPADVEIFGVGCPPAPGIITVIAPDCPFDEQVTLRWSGDCGGDCTRLEFHWQVAAGFNPDDYDDVNPNDPGGQTSGWEDYIDPERGNAQGWIAGQNEIIIRGANIRTLTDNWYRVRFRDPTGSVCGIGAPSTSNWTEPQLAEGWVKRVKRQLNPFDQRVRRFTNSRVATYVSMVEQLGTPYQDRVPMSCDPATLNSIGLIEGYQAVLYRAKGFTLDYGIQYPPANQALILVAGNLADFHALLGNEAYGDSLDPTIALDVDLNIAASSMFSFQDQLPTNENSLLYEELALLRGRDHRGGTTVNRFPVYNRLFWNFTSGDGQVAYKSNYNIQDVYPENPDGSRGDGFINEQDAKVMFPQGHGDAWGHYLTGMKYYYDLLRNPAFDWPVRAESVLVDQVPVQVSFAHERRFARLAAAKAQTGAAIANLTYREQYTEDPSQQWRGYPDPVEGRGWGVNDWGTRAFIGAYFDWVIANANVPSKDDDPRRVGTVQQIDRSNLQGLQELVSSAEEINSLLIQADSGLNPLGLAKNVVPFDIKPTSVTPTPLDRSHFEQIYDRALVVLNNAVSVFNHANQAAQHLRRNQDAVQDFENNVEDAEMDYNSRLIEIFGYPYPEDRDPFTGAPYGLNYSGPDLYHWEYVDVDELLGLEGANALPVGQTITVPFRLVSNNSAGVLTQADTTMDFHIVPGFGLIKPREFRLARKAPGEIQLARSDLIQNWWQLRQAIDKYDQAIKRVESQSAQIQALYGVRSSEIKIAFANLATQTTLDALIIGSKITQKTLKRAATRTDEAITISADALPKVVGLANDALSGARGAIRSTGTTLKLAMEVGADAQEVLQAKFAMAKEIANSGADIGIQFLQREYERETEVRKLETLIRELESAKLEVFVRMEACRQSSGRYQAVIARGERLLAQRTAFRVLTAEKVSNYRYKDMAFRIFRNDALQKYRSQFDLAARYTFLAARAYGFETNLVDFDSRSGEQVLERISRERTLGRVQDKIPQTGSGLAGILAELNGNYQSVRGLLGFNNPTISTDKFSLRRELYRVQSDAAWRSHLRAARVRDLKTEVPEFSQFITSFQPYRTFDPANPENTGEPAIVIRFGSTIQADANFFGRPGLADGGESFFPSDHFSIKIRGVGIWFSNYSDATGGGLASTPRCYLVPIGADVMRVPFADGADSMRKVREWTVVDQVLPLPFNLGEGSFTSRNNGWMPADQLPGNLLEPQTRRYASLRAYHDGGGGLGGIEEKEFVTSTALVGRSVWNTRWILIIPGRFLLQGDPHRGIQRFIDGADGSGGVKDIRLAFQTYQFSGARKPSAEIEIIMEPDPIPQEKQPPASTGGNP